LSEEKQVSEKRTSPVLRKRKIPKFRRQESWRYKKIRENWRKPGGVDSKMRKRIKGWPASPNKGYRNPKDLRGLHPSGLKEAIVTNINDLEKVNPEREAIKIAHTVGERKRTEIVSKAKEMGIRILNPREMKELEEET